MGLVTEGVAQYTQEHYEAALEHFQEAYERKAVPELLINIGRSLHQMNRSQEAIDRFQSFLKQRPHSKLAARVEAFIYEARQNQQAPPTNGISAAVANKSLQRVAIVTINPSMHIGALATSNHLMMAQSLTNQDTNKSLVGQYAREPRSLPVKLTIAGGVISGLGVVGLLVGVGGYAAKLRLKDDSLNTSDEFEKRTNIRHGQVLDGISIAGYVIGGVLLTGGAASLGYGLIQYRVRFDSKARQGQSLKVHLLPGFIGTSFGGVY